MRLFRQNNPAIFASSIAAIYGPVRIIIDEGFSSRRPSIIFPRGTLIVDVCVSPSIGEILMRQCLPLKIQAP